MKSNSAVAFFASFFNGGQLLKERICSKRSKFFPLRADSILEVIYRPQKQTEIYFQFVFPFCRNDRKTHKESVCIMYGLQHFDSLCVYFAD